MTREEIKRIVTETLGRLETDFRDPDRMLEHFHEDGHWIAIGKSATAGKWNRTEFGAMIAGIGQIGEAGLRITPIGFVIEGDKAAVEAESYMKLKNGREYRNQYHFLFEFRGGKIFLVKEYMDTAYAAQVFSP